MDGQDVPQPARDGPARCGGYSPRSREPQLHEARVGTTSALVLAFRVASSCHRQVIGTRRTTNRRPSAHGPFLNTGPGHIQRQLRAADSVEATTSVRRTVAGIRSKATSAPCAAAKNLNIVLFRGRAAQRGYQRPRPRGHWPTPPQMAQDWLMGSRRSSSPIQRCDYGLVKFASVLRKLEPFGVPTPVMSS